MQILIRVLTPKTNRICFIISFKLAFFLIVYIFESSFRPLALILVLDKIKIILWGKNKKNNTTTNKLTDSIASKQEELENEMKTDIKYTFKQNWEGKNPKRVPQHSAKRRQRRTSMHQHSQAFKQAVYNHIITIFI